jgi:hypothetical protein
MKSPEQNVENFAFVSVWKGHSRRCATDSNQDEEVQQHILDIEALRTIGRIVRAINERIEASQISETGNDPKAHRAGDNGGSGAASQDRSQDHGRREENK